MLIYEADSARGRDVLRALVADGHEPVVGGAQGDAVAALARSLGLEHRVFDLDDERLVHAGVSGMGTVVHCGDGRDGRRLRLAEACLAMRATYLDMIDDGEHLEALGLMHENARRRGVVLLPGLTYANVAGDVLAATLMRRLPRPTHLELAVATDAAGLAPAVRRALRSGGLVRSVGRLKPVPAGSPRRRIDLGQGPLVECAALPLGLLSTVWRSTRVPNVISYGVLPRATALLLRIGRHGGGMAGLLVRGRDAAIGRPPAGGRPRLLVWGEVRDDAGRVARARICGLPAAEAMARSIVLALRALATSRPAPGFHTPTSACGLATFLSEPALALEHLPLTPLANGFEPGHQAVAHESA